MIESELADVSITKYEFPWPDEHSGYELFPNLLESDPLVLFHATAKSNFEPIAKEGFKAYSPLTSVSYAKSSAYCLAHLRGKILPLQEDYIVIAVRFETLETPGIQVNLSDINVYRPELQPTIIGYCVVPHEYQHL